MPHVNEVHATHTPAVSGETTAACCGASGSEPTTRSRRNTGFPFPVRELVQKPVARSADMTAKETAKEHR
jgi:hypothetical protein